MEAVAAQVADGNILRLIEKFLRCGVMEDGVFKPTTVGTPQGGVVSPLLANIVLNHLDWRLHKRGFRFVRYADDFVVLCQTKAQAEEALALVKQTLTELGLSLSTEKTRITTYGKGYSFLGFVLSSRSRRMRDKSKRKFQEKVQALTVRSCNLDLPVIEKLNQVIRGTAGYFATGWFTGRHVFRGAGRLDSAARALHEIQAFPLPRQSPVSCQRTGDGLPGRVHSVPTERRAVATVRCGGRPEPERGTPVNMENGLHRDNGEGVAATPLPYPRDAPSASSNSTDVSALRPLRRRTQGNECADRWSGSPLPSTGRGPG